MRPEFAAIRQQLALQLENVSDEYSYLKLDAKKDYYNVSYGELRAQRGETTLEELGEKRRGTKEKQDTEEEEKQVEGEEKFVEPAEEEEGKRPKAQVVEEPVLV
jgi:hypothetical protein